jgi:hypothetical protein
MWSYRIVSKDSKNTQKPTLSKYDKANVRERVFQKQLKRNSYRLGDRVILGNGHTAEVVRIEYNLADVHWEAHIPYFITVKDLVDHKEYVAHPSILKRK